MNFQLPLPKNLIGHHQNGTRNICNLKVLYYQRAGKHSSETSLKYDKLSNSTGKNTFHALPAQATTISSPLLSLARARVSRSGHSCFFFGRRREEAKCRTEISPENGRQNTKWFVASPRLRMISCSVWSAVPHLSCGKSEAFSISSNESARGFSPTARRSGSRTARQRVKDMGTYKVYRKLRSSVMNKSHVSQR